MRPGSDFGSFPPITGAGERRVSNAGRRVAGGSLFLALLAVMVFVLPVAAEASERRVVDRIAAVVGTDIILLSEVLEQALPVIKQMEQSSRSSMGIMADKRKTEVIGQVLEQMINDKLIDAEALEMKISVTAEEINRAMENMAAQNGIDVKTLMDAVTAQGMTVAGYRNKLRNQILRFKVLNLRVRGRIKISEGEARQFYNNQVRDVRATGKFEGAHILVRIPPNPSASEIKDAKMRAEAILNRIEAGEDFADVAKTQSEDKVTAGRGGRLGVLDPGTIPSILDQAFLDMEVDEIEGPIRTAAGLHIIKLIYRESMVQPFVEVKDRIISHLAQEEMARQEKIWLNELRLRTFIDVRL